MSQIAINKLVHVFFEGINERISLKPPIAPILMRPLVLCILSAILLPHSGREGWTVKKN